MRSVVSWDRLIDRFLKPFMRGAGTVTGLLAF
jgi:hypothetical protein